MATIPLALLLLSTQLSSAAPDGDVLAAQTHLQSVSSGLLQADIEAEGIERPASPTRRAQNIVPVFVSRDRLVAVDFQSIERSGDAVTVRYFTVFGKKTGLAKRGDLIGGQYVFECGPAPAVRSVLQRLFSFDGKRTLSEPVLARTAVDLSDRQSENFRLCQAVCNAERLQPPRGATLIYDLAELYVRRLKRRQIL
jgi:hypothetical protein